MGIFNIVADVIVANVIVANATVEEFIVADADCRCEAWGELAP